MPQTLSSKKGVLPSDDLDSDDRESPGIQNIKGYLSKIDKEFSSLQNEINNLKKRNRELEEEIQRSQDQAETSQSGRGKRANSAIVQELETTINHLKAERRKKDKIIEKMKDKELKREAQDLLDTQPDSETGEDTVQRMRKLLRRFNDLMIVTTLGDGDECPICMEKMRTEQSSAFNCQHLVCNDCFKDILPDKDEEFPCPVCRQKTPRDEIELVHMTEEDRWDSLLKVAEAWAAFDHRPELDTSEEEGETAFINDATTSRSASSEVGIRYSDDAEEQEPAQSQSEEEGEDPEGSTTAPSTPPPRPSYSQSPSKEKRKRLAELAEGRARKRRC